MDKIINYYERLHIDPKTKEKSGNGRLLSAYLVEELKDYVILRKWGEKKVFQVEKCRVKKD